MWLLSLHLNEKKSTIIVILECTGSFTALELLWIFICLLIASVWCVCRFPISMEWNGEVVTEKVVWFQYESDITLNSNVFEVAHKLVQKHFPGMWH